MRAAQKGDTEAFGRLVCIYERRLTRFLRMRAARHEDVDAAVQDAFVRAWDRIDLCDPDRPFAAWLFTIAARERVSAQRSALRKATQAGAPRAAALESVVDTADGPFDAAANAELRTNIWDIVLDVLGPEHRTALWLFYGEDLPTSEIADILDKRCDAVRALLSRARQRLAPHLAAHTSAVLPCERLS